MCCVAASVSCGGSGSVSAGSDVRAAGSGVEVFVVLLESLDMLLRECCVFETYLCTYDGKLYHHVLLINRKKGAMKINSKCKKNGVQQRASHKELRVRLGQTELCTLCQRCSLFCCVRIAEVTST